jgi:hypothetical protein
LHVFFCALPARRLITTCVCLKTAHKLGIVEALNINDIKGLFRQSSSAELALPDLAPIDWGILDYLGWIHPSGSTAFVVMPV